MKWKEYTSTTKFAADFEEVMEKHAGDNEERAARIEQFFIEEAQNAEVIKVNKIRKYKNPNRIEK
jgi:hypothetical protein